MKTKNLIISLILIISYNYHSNAQKVKDEDVPQDVFISFKYKYPDATINEWQKKDTIFTAFYELNNQEGYADISEKGKWLQTKHNIREKELPSPVISYYRDNYKSQEYIIDDVELVKTNKGETFYHVTIKKPGIAQPDPIDLYFDFTGKFLRKVDPNEVKIEKDIASGKVTSSKTKAPKNTIPTPEDKAKELEQFLILDTKVPENIKATFKSKAKKAAGTAWYFKENKYIARAVVSGKKTQMTYSKEGIWLETKTESSAEVLNPQIENCMKSKFKGYAIKYVENIQTSTPKDKFIYVIAYEKKDRGNPNPPLTEIFFDGNGKFRNVNRADVIDQRDIDAQKRQDAKNNQFQTGVENSGIKYEGGEGVNNEVGKKELPTPILKYIKQNYPEYKVKEAVFTFNDELDMNVYYVKIKKERTRHNADLYFDLQGKFLKKVDSTDKKAEKEIEINDFDE